MEEVPKRGREDVEAVDGSAKRARVDVVASAESSSTVSNAGAAAAPLAAPAAAAAAVAHAKRLSNYGNADGKLCIRNAGKWSDKKEWVKKLNALEIKFRNVIKQRGSTFAMVSFSSDAEREAGRVQLKAASYKGKPLDVRDAKAKKVKKRAHTWDMKRDAGAKRSRGGGAVAAVDAKPRTIHDAVTPLHNVPYATQLEQKQEMMEDAMDGALDEGDEDEEADELVSQVFDEIGIDLGEQFSAAPSATAASAQAEPEPAAAETDDLEARLNALRNG